jgi:type IV pilus assembly protein PilE
MGIGCVVMNKKNLNVGFTLIELLIVIAVIALLTMIAMPSYLGYITKANRSVGRAELLKVASRQEQYFINNKAYANDLELLGYPADPYFVTREGDASDAAGVYSIDITAQTVTTFTLSATPSGSHADPDCLVLSFTEQGNKTATGTGIKCWD